MSRYSRLRHTVLLFTVCFMSYVGLICRVQVLLSTSHMSLQEDSTRLLDHQLNAGGHDKNYLDNKSHMVAAGESLTMGNEKAQEFNDSQEEPTNSTRRVHYDSAVGSSLTANERHRVVNFIPVGNMYVFGAYLDQRRPERAIVRLFVLRHSKVRDAPVLFATDQAGKNYTLHAQPYRMCEGHGKAYEGWIYSYLLPGALMALPHCISVAPSSHRQADKTNAPTMLELRVIPPHVHQHADNIGVCVPPLFGNLQLASIIHFMQMCRVMGADRLFMYVGDVSSEIRTFLTYRSQKDASLSIMDWNLPDNVTQSSNSVWNQGQMLAIQHCLYHNMAAIHFLLFMDVDEMLVPRTTRDWPDMLKALFSTHHSQHSVAALSFPSAFFDPTRIPQDSGNVAYFQHLQRTAWTSRRRSKLMVQPLMVFELGIHHLSRALQDGAGGMEIGEEVALLHHYRRCEDRDEGGRVTCDLMIEDRSMLRYRERLTQLSQPIITEASRLFA